MSLWVDDWMNWYNEQLKSVKVSMKGFKIYSRGIGYLINGYDNSSK